MFTSFGKALQRGGLMVGLIYFVTYMLVSWLLYAALFAAAKNGSAISMALLFILIFCATAFLTGAAIRSFQYVIEGIPVTLHSFLQAGWKQWVNAAVRLFLIIVLPMLLIFWIFDAIFAFVGFGNIMQLHYLVSELTISGFIAVFIVFVLSLILMSLYVFSLSKYRVGNFFRENILPISVYYFVALILSCIPWIGTFFSALMLAFYPLLVLSLKAGRARL